MGTIFVSELQSLLMTELIRLVWADSVSGTKEYSSGNASLIILHFCWYVGILFVLLVSASVVFASHVLIFSVHVNIDALYKLVLRASSHGAVYASKSYFDGEVIQICNHSLLLIFPDYQFWTF